MKDLLWTWFRAGLIIAFQTLFKTLAVLVGLGVTVKRRLFDQ